LISTAAKELGFDESPFIDLLRVKEGTLKLPREKMEETVEMYMRTIREVWKRVDQLEMEEG
jgi:hypothetical protein